VTIDSTEDWAEEDVEITFLDEYYNCPTTSFTKTQTGYVIECTEDMSYEYSAGEYLPHVYVLDEGYIPLASTI
jgi:hypothetical protein